MPLTVLNLGDGAAWDAALERCRPYDFYHTHGYHALAAARGEGEPRLFVFEDGADVVCLPLLLRPIPVSLVSADGNGPLWDTSSVYGYGGPVSSPAGVSPGAREAFGAALTTWLREAGVVALFSRLHPLLEQRHLLAGLGDVADVGTTVSMDLTQPPEVQRAQYRKNHKEGVNRLRRQGVTVEEFTDADSLETFSRIYTETMTRVGAAAHYFFDLDYFRQLATGLGEKFHLFLAKQDGETLAGGVFVDCCGILQYHLGGTRDAHLKVAPMKLVFDQLRLWGTERGLSVFHLGGGNGGSSTDSLFAFKSGFSDRRHVFSLWRWVVAPEKYDVLMRRRDAELEAAGTPERGRGFFPAYRR